MKLLLANPRGFCAGVDRAIVIVERAIELFSAPIFVRHEVVHNRYVVETLKKRGAVFVEELDEVPDGATVIFSAHGVSQSVREEAKQRELNVFDATCPLVTKVHMEVKRYRRWGKEVILIGHEGHPEVVGTMGQAEGGMYLVENVGDVEKLVVQDEDALAFVTQTTLSVDDTRIVIDALRARFPNIEGPDRDDICYATQNRQDAVRSLSEACDVMLVVGSVNSSNSNRLRELAQSYGCMAYLIDAPEEIKPKWLEGCNVIGVTAGASAPEVLVQSVVHYLEEQGAEPAQEYVETRETVSFSVPITLRGVEVEDSLATYQNS